MASNGGGLDSLRDSDLSLLSWLEIQDYIFHFIFPKPYKAQNRRYPTPIHLGIERGGCEMPSNAAPLGSASPKWDFPGKKETLI